MSKTRRPRCDNCGRVLYSTDFDRGLAEGEQVQFHTLYGVDERDENWHTYDCMAARRRLVQSAATPQPE